MITNIIFGILGILLLAVSIVITMIYAKKQTDKKDKDKLRAAWIIQGLAIVLFVIMLIMGGISAAL